MFSSNQSMLKMLGMHESIVTGAHEIGRLLKKNEKQNIVFSLGCTRISSIASIGEETTMIISDDTPIFSFDSSYRNDGYVYTRCRADLKASKHSKKHFARFFTATGPHKERTKEKSSKRESEEKARLSMSRYPLLGDAKKRSEGVQSHKLECHSQVESV